MERFLSNNIEDYPEGIILPIDKPYRWTSADVIRKLKYAAIRHFGKKNLKVGHAGTLDPLATGILLVCIGAATKRAEELQASRKQYIAGVSFGATTASYDLEKDIDNFFPLDGVCEESLKAVLPSFIGEQQQVAPLFSAKSVDGVRAYETARKLYKEGRLGDAADLIRASTINIYDLELLSWKSDAAICRNSSTNGLEAKSTKEASVGNGEGTGSSVASATASDLASDLASVSSVASATASIVASDLASTSESNQRNSRINVADISSLGLPEAKILVDCSKGTYIRALARDLGEALGSGAFLSSLRRTKNGGFSIEDAISIDQALEMLG